MYSSILLEIDISFSGIEMLFFWISLNKSIAIGFIELGKNSSRKF